MVNHSLTKCLLFLTAGHIVQGYRTKKVADVQGLLKTLPTTGILFLTGGMAIMGLPPFAPFISKFLILKESLVHSYPVVAGFYLFFLGIILVAMSKIFLRMAQGEKRELPGSLERYPYLVIPPILLAIAIFVLGIYLPSSFVHFLQEAAQVLGGG